MSYKDLEDKITQDKIAIRYNVVAEGAAMKAEDYPEVKEILPTEEPFRKIALEILYEDKINALKDVKKSLEEGYSPIELINNALMKGIDAVSTLYTKGDRIINRMKLGESNASAQRVPANNEVASFRIQTTVNISLSVHNQHLIAVVPDKILGKAEQFGEGLLFSFAGINQWIHLLQFCYKFAVNVIKTPLQFRLNLMGETRMNRLLNTRMHKAV